VSRSRRRRMRRLLGTKPVFFDMVHSNNAARVRLWMALKKPGGMADAIDVKMVTYPELQTASFATVNPLRKVPGLLRADGTTVFESSVILNYLEDKYSDTGPAFTPPTPEGRQEMELLCRVHDLYIASPNTTAAGFSHSQGAMYLSAGWHGAARGMDLKTRSLKLGEIWRQLSWLEAVVAAKAHRGPHLLGELRTLADLTWFPTCVFMEFMLPRFFGWPQLWGDNQRTPPLARREEEAEAEAEAVPTQPPPPTPFPALARWYAAMRETEAFASVRDDIYSYWQGLEAAGQWRPILEEIAANTDPSLKLTYGLTRRVVLNYQAPPPPGKATGRYIDQPDRGDLADEHLAAPVQMGDGRELSPPASLESMGFALKPWPSKCTDFGDEAQVREIYYDEMRDLVKEASGAMRVFIFDHTLRESGNTALNAAAGGSAAPVPRVHCDYTADGAPRRLHQLGEEGIVSKLRGRTLTAAEAAELASGRFAFVNVWRSIDEMQPVLQQPLAVCDERSVPESDRFLYELRFPDRTGENYSLRHSAAHRWYSYRHMTKDECLVFKVYDKKEDGGPRFVFHTAFTDPDSPPDAPPRRSIEVRAIAFYDPPPLGAHELAT